MTQTYNLRDTALAVGWLLAQNEFEANTGTGTPTTDTETIAPGGLIAWIWSTPSNEPNVANWPVASSEDPYECRVDVSAIGADLVLDVLNHDTFVRMSSDTNSALEGDTGTFDSATGTGLKTVSNTTWDPAAGSATDRFSVRIDVDNTNSMFKEQDITIQNLNTTTVYVKGPWGSAAAAPRVVKQSPYPQILAH